MQLNLINGAESEFLENWFSAKLWLGGERKTITNFQKHLGLPVPCSYTTTWEPHRGLGEDHHSQITDEEPRA